MNDLLQTVPVLHGGLTADLRIGSGAQSLGDVATDLDTGLDPCPLQCLGVGVGADKVHALDTGPHHVHDSVTATATDADHLDDRRFAVTVH